jgi:membrane protein YdbS with pleckstrin-like domain
MLIFIFLPAVVQISIGIIGLIYIILGVARLKKDGSSKYRIIEQILMALAIFLAIVLRLIQVKFTELRSYHPYIMGIIFILVLVAYIPLPLLNKYKEGGWESLKKVIWVSLFQTFLLFGLYILYNL